MKEQSRDGISVVSETSVYEGEFRGLHFSAAWGWGTLAGTLGLLIAFLMLELPNVPISELLGGVLFFGFFVGLFTLVGLVVIGLPVTFILCIVEAEYQLLYAALGALSGFATMLLLFGHGSSAEFEELLFAGPGGLAGGAAAWRWGGWREAKATARKLNSLPDHHPED